ncbi:MAG: hypothetical protein JWO59_205 [Chloroflexi bacterium]|nr:hypothetical protein [Chloroflexota bacterium]
MPDFDSGEWGSNPWLGTLHTFGAGQMVRHLPLKQTIWWFDSTAPSCAGDDWSAGNKHDQGVLARRKGSMRSARCAKAKQLIMGWSPKQST